MKKSTTFSRFFVLYGNVSEHVGMYMYIPFEVVSIPRYDVRTHRLKIDTVLLQYYVNELVMGVSYNLQTDDQLL